MRTGAAGTRGTRHYQHTICALAHIDLQEVNEDSLKSRADVSPLYSARDVVQAATRTPPRFLDTHARFLLERVHGVPQSLSRNGIEYSTVEGRRRFSLREQGRLSVRIAYRGEIRWEVLHVSGRSSWHSNAGGGIGRRTLSTALPTLPRAAYHAFNPFSTSFFDRVICFCRSVMTPLGSSPADKR